MLTFTGTDTDIDMARTDSRSTKMSLLTFFKAFNFDSLLLLNSYMTLLVAVST